MKKSNTLNNRLLTVSLAFVLITGLLSCNDNNGSQTEADEGDSTHMNDNISNTSTTTVRQDGTMNDSTKTGASNNPSMDAAFMMQAAEINLEEIKLGNLAQQKGTMSHVKALGKMMVTDHSKALAGLTALAKTKMVDIPATETEKIIGAYKTLSEKKGKEFDKAFSDMMVNGHKEAIALFEKTNLETKDADVKALTTALIPTLKTHLEHAEKCKKECDKM